MRIYTSYRRVICVALSLLAASCGQSDLEVEGEKSLERHVKGNVVGSSPDHWIEMRNMSGEWERTGLIFGYVDDYSECQTAIAGLKKVNFVREYRCVPANRK